MLSVDYSLFIQIANFLVLLIVLNAILFKPIRKILSQRAAEMTGFEERIQDFLIQSDRSSQELQENMVGARKEGFTHKEELKKEGLEKEKELVQEAMASTGDKVSEAKKKIESDILSARQGLEAEMSAFSRELAEKILGRALS